MTEYMTKHEAVGFFQDVKDLFAQTDKKFQETDRQFKETDKKIKELSVKIGQLGGRLGDFVEEMVKPSVVRLFKGRGLDVRHVSQHVTSYDDQGRFLMEIDLLVVDTDTAVAIECKSNCSVEDVEEHLERLSRFKEYFPHYEDFQLFGAVAAMVMPDDVTRHAYRQGLYVLAQSGDTVLIRNDDQFRPKKW
ncbi:MAG: DUF3782 domain-containing protein [Desulfovermiculus sp.]|nr:DUF3782 domain-containing protein [Desulfovermiculus sp.]